MKRKAADVIQILEQWAPPGLQESWDNSGLCIGNSQTPVTGAVVCLDCTEEVIEEAVSEGVNMVISHHPLIFKGLKHLRDATPVERTVALAVRHHMVLYCMHTNADKVMDGVSGAMAEALGLKNKSILSRRMRQAAGSRRNRYFRNSCLRIRCIVGDLPEEMDTGAFFSLLKSAFGLKHFKASDMYHRRISRVALCGGSGSSLIPFALESGAQIFVSADFSYHAYFETVPQLMLADIGHYESEAEYWK